MRYNHLTITGHKLEITPAMREYVLGKLARPTRHFDQIMSISVLMKCVKASKKEDQKVVEVTLRLKGQEFFAKKTGADLYAAIDRLMDCLDRQIVASKTKVQQHRHIPPKRVQAVT